jgi:hypothetical protein
MESVANELLSELQAAGRLRDFSESAASVKPAPNKWSKKEILGHLIDSAANNHQRFVRMQLSTRIDLPGYDQDRWVELGRYQERPWKDIVDLWVTYNTHLAAVIRNIEPGALRNVWHTPDGEDKDLDFIARDYVAHMRHHLNQIFAK